MSWPVDHANRRLAQLNQLSVVVRYIKTAFGDALWRVQLQFLIQLIGRQLFAEEFLVGHRDRGDLVGRMMDKLDAKISDTGFNPWSQRFGIRLRFGSENGVATTDVRHHRVRPPFGVANGKLMLFARMAAVGVVRSVGQESAEDAMLGMKYR